MNLIWYILTGYIVYMCVNSRSMEQLLSEKREPCFCESTCGTVGKVSDTWLSHASGTGSILLILMWHWGDDISWSVTVRRVMSVQENGSQEEPCDLMASGLGGSGLSTEIKEPLLANYIHHLRSAPYCLISSWHLHHNWVGDSLGQWVRELGWLDTLCTCVNVPD